MHEHRNDSHDKLQRRVRIGVIVFAVLALLIVVPLTVDDQLRYDLTMRTGQIPGQDAEKLAEGDEGAMLVVVPIEHGQHGVPTPWVFKAQFIAWPGSAGLQLENLESGERVDLPLAEIEFIAANSDGSLLLMRGDNAFSGEPVGITVSPSTMEFELLPDPGAVPAAPGDWETSIWTKQGQRCHRPSPGMRFVACFVSSDLRSYFAGDWELNIQVWGDYDEQFPVFRGMGFLPITGFVHDDTVIYFQNENGIWKADVPEDAFDVAPSPVATPQP